MLIVKRFEVNPVLENTYVVWDDATRCAAIVDCGCFTSREKEVLKNYIEEMHLSVKYILNTHLHFDHCYGMAFASDEWDVPVMTHRKDVEEMPSPAEQMSIFGLSGKIDLPKLPYHFLEKDEILDFGANKIRVLFVPGHSPGHLAFFFDRDYLVFSGDTLFRGEIGRCDLWGGDYNGLLHNTQTELFTLPENTKVYPGHGDDTEIGYEKNNNPYFLH